MALEALKSDKTINQIAQEGRGLPVQVSAWEKVLQSKLLALFESGAKRQLMEEAGIAEWMGDHNHHRIHQALDYAIPWQLYRPHSGLAHVAVDDLLCDPVSVT